MWLTMRGWWWKLLEQWYEEQSAWKPSSGFTGKAASYGVQSNWATWACWLKAELWPSLAHLQEMSVWLAKKITHPSGGSTWSIKQLWWPVQWSNSTVKNSSIQKNSMYIAINTCKVMTETKIIQSDIQVAHDSLLNYWRPGSLCVSPSKESYIKSNRPSWRIPRHAGDRHSSYKCRNKNISDGHNSILLKLARLWLKGKCDIFQP